MRRKVLVRRSLVKAITYRLVIMRLDSCTIHFFNRALRMALGFMVASNVYTKVAFLLHERLWARIEWGLQEAS